MNCNVILKFYLDMDYYEEFVVPDWETAQTLGEELVHMHQKGWYEIEVY